MSKLTDLVWDLARPVAERCGCSVWDVEFVKEAGQKYLRIYLDREDGVTINHCESVSREMDSILDELDPIEESYIFEVSSAGVERQLKRPSDFERFIGHNVEVRLYSPQNGKKVFIGTLAVYDNGDITISSPDGETHFAKDRVAMVRLRI